MTTALLRPKEPPKSNGFPLEWFRKLEPFDARFRPFTITVIELSRAQTDRRQKITSLDCRLYVMVREEMRIILVQRQKWSFDASGRSRRIAATFTAEIAEESSQENC